MKRIFLIFLIMFFLFPRSSYSQELTEETPASEYITMETAVGVQSVLTGEIPLIVRFTPNTDSKKASIQWDLPYGVESDSDLKQWFPVEKGTEYEVRIWVTGQENGKYEIPVNVDVWLYNSSHINTQKVQLELDESLRSVPIPYQYYRNMVFKWVAVVLLLMVGAFVFLRLWNLLYPKFNKWLER